MSEAQVDQLLVERVQKGDKKAFDLLISKYQHRIISLVARYVSDQPKPWTSHRRPLSRRTVPSTGFAATVLFTPGFTGSRSTRRKTGWLRGKDGHLRQISMRPMRNSTTWTAG